MSLMSIPAGPSLPSSVCPAPAARNLFTGGCVAAPRAKKKNSPPPIQPVCYPAHCDRDHINTLSAARPFGPDEMAELDESTEPMITHTRDRSAIRPGRDGRVGRVYRADDHTHARQIGHSARTSWPSQRMGPVIELDELTIAHPAVAAGPLGLDELAQLDELDELTIPHPAVAAGPLGLDELAQLDELDELTIAHPAAAAGPLGPDELAQLDELDELTIAHPAVAAGPLGPDELAQLDELDELTTYRTPSGGSSATRLGRAGPVGRVGRVDYVSQTQRWQLGHSARTIWTSWTS